MEHYQTMAILIIKHGGEYQSFKPCPSNPWTSFSMPVLEEKQNPWRCSVPFFRAWEEAKNTVHMVGVQLRLVELWLYHLVN